MGLYNSSATTFIIVFIILLIVAVIIDDQLHKPPVKNIKTYKGFPFIGTLLEHTSKPYGTNETFSLIEPNFMKFYKFYNNKNNKYEVPNNPEFPIFQFRIGKNWVLVINNVELYKETFIKNSKKIDDRPKGESFHGILSKSNESNHSIFTIGTTPQGPEYMLKKNFFMKEFINNHNLENFYQKIIAYECKLFKQQVEDQCLDPLPLLQKYVSRIACWVTFGIDLNAALDKHYSLSGGIIDEIAFIEREIVKLRNPITNTLDHMPKFFQLFFFLKKNNKIKEIKERREKYITLLFNFSELEFKNQSLINNKKEKNDFEKMAFENCLIYKFLKMKNTTNNAENFLLTKEHILSICLTTMSAGLDNVSLLMNHILHQLGQGTKQMEHYQNVAFNDILRITGTKFNTKQCYCDTPCIFNDEEDIKDFGFTNLGSFGKCESVRSLMNEGIRYLSVAPLGLPRLTSSDIFLCRNIKIPKNTIVVPNLFLINHNESTFENSLTFDPFRFEANGSCRCIQCQKGTEICNTNHISLTNINKVTDLHNILMQKELSKTPEQTLEDESKSFENINSFISNNLKLNKTIENLNFEDQLLKIEKPILNSSIPEPREFNKNTCLINGFGKGARSCLGKKLAESEMYYLLLTILKNFNVEGVDYKFEPASIQCKNKFSYEELDPRINNSSFDSIALEQTWNSFIHFKKRSCRYKKLILDTTLVPFRSMNDIPEKVLEIPEERGRRRTDRKNISDCSSVETDEYVYRNSIPRSQPMDIFKNKRIINIE